jgi:hypothetical protein
MRRLVAAVLLAGCGHSQHTSDTTAEVIARSLSCASLYDPRAPDCYPRHPKTGGSLAGQVLLHGPLGTTPVAYVEVQLLREGKTIATTATDRQGHFTFRRWLPEKSYDLVLGPGDYEARLTVRMDARTSEVFLFAKPVTASR